jgi:hypothetical protein
VVDEGGEGRAIFTNVVIQVNAREPCKRVIGAGEGRWVKGFFTLLIIQVDAREPCKRGAGTTTCTVWKIGREGLQLNVTERGNN